MTYDIFEKYYKKIEESIDLDRAICELLENMSPEDEHDSAILRSIIDKTAERTNAKLTPEEKEILDKYGLTREDRAVRFTNGPRYLVNWDSDISNPSGGNKSQRKHPHPLYKSLSRMPRYDRSKINYADVARKRGPRAQAVLDKVENDTIQQYQRAIGDFKSAKWNRDYHQEYIDKADDAYIAAMQKAKAQYDAAIKAAADARDRVDNYHAPARDRSQSSINSIYDRFKK